MSLSCSEPIRNSEQFLVQWNGLAIYYQLNFTVNILLYFGLIDNNKITYACITLMGINLRFWIYLGQYFLRFTTLNWIMKRIFIIFFFLVTHAWIWVIVPPLLQAPLTNHLPPTPTTSAQCPPTTPGLTPTATRTTATLKRWGHPRRKFPPQVKNFAQSFVLPIPWVF